MIDKHIEKEYKMMLEKNDYDNLLNKYHLIPFKQINHYYSTNNPKVAMRIRIIDDKYIFTLKYNQIEYKDEYEFEIKDNTLNDSRIQELLNKFNITNPEYLGSMTTYRAILKLEYGEICLDYNLYLNLVDYELEYELYDYQKENDEFNLFLKENNLIFNKSKRSKYGRFIFEKGRNLNA